jgi:hypothetical protein
MTNTLNIIFVKDKSNKREIGTVTSKGIIKSQIDSKTFLLTNGKEEKNENLIIGHYILVDESGCCEWDTREDDKYFWDKIVSEQEFPSINTDSVIMCGNVARPIESSMLTDGIAENLHEEYFEKKKDSHSIDECHKMTQYRELPNEEKGTYRLKAKNFLSVLKRSL